MTKSQSCEVVGEVNIVDGDMEIWGSEMAKEQISHNNEGSYPTDESSNSTRCNDAVPSDHCEFWSTPWIPDITSNERESQESQQEAEKKRKFLTDNNHIQLLERKLNKLKGKSELDGKSMLATLKLAKDDFMKNFINEEYQNCSQMDSEDVLSEQNFFDKLYNTNVVYRHLFPEKQSLGTLEKQPLLEKSKISDIESLEKADHEK